VLVLYAFAILDFIEHAGSYAGQGRQPSLSRTSIDRYLQTSTPATRARHQRRRTRHVNATAPKTIPPLEILQKIQHRGRIAAEKEELCSIYSTLPQIDYSLIDSHFREIREIAREKYVSRHRRRGGGARGVIISSPRNASLLRYSRKMGNKLPRGLLKCQGHITSF